MTKARDLSQTPNASLGFKNRIINGAMMIDQRNAGASVTLSTDNKFPVDRFAGYADTDGVMTAQRDTTAPAGFVNSIKFTTTTADASLGSTQLVSAFQNIEGTNVADLGWGTANAQPVTLSFWVRSSLTGTFGGALVNTNGTRSYPFSYTISAANTWEQKSVTIAGDTTGTWLTDTGVGIRVRFGLGVGSTFSGTAGSWQASNLFSATGATSVIGTLNATWQITGVQLEKGSTATSFDYRPYGTELQLCQRYFQRIGSDGNANFHALAMWNVTTTSVSNCIIYPVIMRSSPTATIFGTPINASGGSVSTDKWALYNNGGWVGCSSITLSNLGTTNVRVDPQPNNSVTAGGASGLYGGTQCYFTFSAEL